MGTGKIIVFYGEELTGDIMSGISEIDIEEIKKELEWVKTR